jgi:hypothetical protein
MFEHGSTASAQRLDLQVDGVFDEEEARHLVSLLARFAPRQRVRVYFHHVRQFHDRVVALLVGELTAPYGRNIELAGLSQHQLRVLRYMTGSRT